MPVALHADPATRRFVHRLAGWTLIGAAGLWLGMPALAGGSGGGSEQRVKAAFLYKFLGYVDFPRSAFAEPQAPLTIGMVGADDMVPDVVRVVSGRSVGQRKISVRPLREFEAGMPVHLLFIGGRDPVRVGRLIRQANAPLIVTECDDGLRQGSTINFRMIDDRVRFDVAVDAADRNGIKMSSRLLTVANRVQKGTQ
jgi:hypothetical protein